MIAEQEMVGREVGGRRSEVGANPETSVIVALAGMLELLVKSNNSLHARQVELEQRLAEFEQSTGGAR